MYMYDLIDVKEYTDTEFDQDQGSSDCTNCPDNTSWTSVRIPDKVIEEQRTSLDRNKDGILSYKELLFGLLRKFQIEGRLKSMKILMIACKTNKRKLNSK